jgi:hypothetical protein
MGNLLSGLQAAAHHQPRMSLALLCSEQPTYRKLLQTAESERLAGCSDHRKARDVLFKQLLVPFGAEAITPDMTPAAAVLFEKRPTLKHGGNLSAPPLRPVGAVSQARCHPCGLRHRRPRQPQPQASPTARRHLRTSCALPADSKCRWEPRPSRMCPTAAHEDAWH